VFSALLVALSNYGFLTRRVDQTDLRLKVVQMGFRPVDLDQNSLSWLGNHEAKC
jgi:hypothetical protein